MAPTPRNRPLAAALLATVVLAAPLAGTLSSQPLTATPGRSARGAASVRGSHGATSRESLPPRRQGAEPPKRAYGDTADTGLLIKALAAAWRADDDDELHALIATLEQGGPSRAAALVAVAQPGDDPEASVFALELALRIASNLRRWHRDSEAQQVEAAVDQALSGLLTAAPEALLDLVADDATDVLIHSRLVSLLKAPRQRL